MHVATKGAPMRKFITSRWFNEQNKRRMSPIAGNPIASENPIHIGCVGEVDGMSRFDPASITGPFLQFEDWGDGVGPQQNLIACKVSSTLDDYWGVLQGPCDTETSTKLVLAGVTWANFEVLDEDHTHVTRDGDNLITGGTGRARILYKEPGTTPYDTYGLIMLESTSSGLFLYELETEWTNKLATATISTPENTGPVTGKSLKDPLLLMTDQTIGDQGWCMLYGSAYYAIQAPCTGNGGSSGGNNPYPVINPTTLVVSNF